MNSYETTATVEVQGEIRVAGVPFAPGTRVEVTITASRNGDGPSDDADPGRVRRLFAALDKACNNEPVGPLRREELYDRDILR